jgi:hypothetical protein
MVRMVQYTYTSYKNNILLQEIPNLSLHEAYTIAKPPYMNINNNRWHLMIYNAVVERIALKADNENLLVAWEEDMENMESEYRYITRNS